MRRLALLGAAEGPWIDISRVRRPAIRVTGLAEKDSIEVRLELKDRVRLQLHFFGSKDHSLSDFGAIGWLAIRTEGPKRDLICEVIEQAA